MAGTDYRRPTATGGPAIVLVAPQLGENIGTATRAMFNCGLSDLRLVAPRDGWPSEKARSAASGADAVIDAARLFDTVEAAIGDLQRVYATTARDRYMVKRVVTPRQAASEMRALAGEGIACGVLFGPERAGLLNEHVDPLSVGNRRHIVVSDQAGRSNLVARLRDLGIEVDPGNAKLGTLLDLVKQREFAGYAYDGAEASFELLARRSLGEVPEYFRLTSFRVIDERRWNARGELVTLSEATIKVDVGGAAVMTVAEGNGPVNALDSALRQALIANFPELDSIRLTDYKVRILTPQDGTKAVTRVMIETSDEAGAVWSTVGVSTNVIDASFNALHDSLTYKLWREGRRA